MARLAVVLAVMIGLMSSESLAGQASASFSVGITIGRGNRPKQAVVPVSTFTWGAAAISVRRKGFHVLRRLQKSDRLYWFAANRNGSMFKVAVLISTGVILKVIPA